MGKHRGRSVNNVTRAVFLDRDGVLTQVTVREGLPYPPPSAEELVLYPDVITGCARLKEAGYLLVVVTNQPDIGRGTQSRAMVDAMHNKLAAALPVLDRIEMCAHAGCRFGEPCDCRKPQPGMLRRAAADLQIDLPPSYLIGDRWRDVECAFAAGCKSIFIDREYAEPLRRSPDFIVDSFHAAVEIVLKRTAAGIHV